MIFSTSLYFDSSSSFLALIVESKAESLTTSLLLRIASRLSSRRMIVLTTNFIHALSSVLIAVYNDFLRTSFTFGIGMWSLNSCETLADFSSLLSLNMRLSRMRITDNDLISFGVSSCLQKEMKDARTD